MFITPFLKFCVSLRDGNDLDQVRGPKTPILCNSNTTLRALGFGFRAFKALGLGFKVSGLGLRDLGFGTRGWGVV